MMNDRAFILNHRFLINPSIGSVYDLKAKAETRIEPRVMNLLCLLTAHNGKLVGRAIITKKIWDDYGNADEGLTQAVSYLRKVLADDSKKLIETVPKKGYVLHAVISEPVSESVKVNFGKTNKKYLVLIIIVIVLPAVVWLIFKPFHSARSNNPDMIQKVQTSGSSNVKGRSPDLLPDTAKSKSRIADKKK
jgi:DNA-binding winged helix-turn-helix (wHTH) protein